MSSDAEARWVGGYGPIRHTSMTQRRVRAMAAALAQMGVQGDGMSVDGTLFAADRIASAAMWLVVHETYARNVYLDGRPLRAEICDCERDNSPSLPQALYLLNDAEVLTKIHTPTGRLARLLASEKKDRELIEELYLAALSRPPTRTETETTLRHLAKWQVRAKGQQARQEAFEDVLWALLNLKEFVTNH